MKTIPPPCPEPESGRKYWRSLDHLADSPEFRQWAEREFPAGASEWTDPVSRRHFVQIMGASFLLAGLGLTGCRRPEEKILPFSKMPENYVHGVAQYYATAMPTRGGAIPLLVKQNEGRPTKVEGNSLHPVHGNAADAVHRHGGTDLHAQASILGLYDPDRAQRFTQGGNEVRREVVLDHLAAVSQKFILTQGEGLAFLLEANSSASRQRLRIILGEKFPKAKWAVYEPVDLTVARRLTGTAPFYKLDGAKVILSLDCDFLSAEEDAFRHCRNFAKGRKLTKPTDALNRLYAVEGLMTLAGVNADHRLRVPTSQVVAVAAAIAKQIAPDNAQIKALAQRLPLPDSVKPAWVTECAADLAANKGASLVLAGHRQPLAVHIVASLLNTALGNDGKTVFFSELPQLNTTDTIASLAPALNAGQVDTLVVLGGNPVYNAPADLDWAAAQARAKEVIRLGYYEDESFAGATWHLPMAHYLESWGDARTSDGTLAPIQPLLAPLFDGLTEIEVLARLGAVEANKSYDIMRDTFRIFVGNAGFEEKWKKFLHDGFHALSGPSGGDAPIPGDRITTAFAGVTTAVLSKDNLEVVFHRSHSLDDGRWNNNGWLQELPDPITKIVWDNVILVSRKTADELGLSQKEVIEVELGARKIEGPVWIQPGMADYSLGLALGYGRKRTAKGGAGRVGNEVGLYDAYALRTTAAEHFGVGAKIRKTGRTFKISSTQDHGSMEGRPIVREANLEQYKKLPKFAQNMGLEAHASHIPADPKTGRPKGIYEHPYEAYDARKSQNGVALKENVFKSEVHQWGMSIDLNSCVGCAACVMACQSENNIPIVGKEQVSRNREMHWLRIDRYFSGTSDADRKNHPSLMDDPQVITQPMLCQHCESAPCETVCPVNATAHDEEGLNVMAYNRCVGTRYCSNNCPYKVRRFNFFDYHKHPLDSLYQSPLTSGSKGRWNMLNWWKEPAMHHTVAEDHWDLLQLVKNPDVSVRMRGVMEKCTFCVQRIEQAKIAQKNKAGQSGDVQVKEGAFTTACAQACPADAIVFGNVLDPNSRVSQAKKLDRDYSVLGFLDTRPRITYLARVRNPNPKMPDYAEIPLNIKEYTDQQTTSPFEEHAHGHAPAAGEKKGAH